VSVPTNNLDFTPVNRKPGELERIVRPSRTFWQDAWAKLVRHPLGMFGFILVVLVTVIAIFGPMMIKVTYSDQDLTKTYLDSFTPGHPFGTDNLGRDVLVRILVGARISLTVGVVSTVIALVIGITYGAISGYFGGRVDNLMMRFIEVMSAVPELLYMILLTQILPPNLTTILIVIGATSWLNMARLVRGEVLTLKEREFVLSARTMGTKPLAIMFRHLVPNSLGPIIVAATIGIPQAIFFESFLSFIGLGISAPLASWGVMASEALSGIRSYPALLFYPAAAIGITLLAFQFLGQGLRDALDPRVQQK
jgi:oligopeptide transport system permease protein